MEFTFTKTYEDLDLEFEIEVEVYDDEIVKEVIYFKDEEVTDKLKKEIRDELLADVWGAFDNHIKELKIDYWFDVADSMGYRVSGGIA